jgi:hypothetical protein
MPDVQFWDDKLMEEIQVIQTLISSRSDPILFGSELDDDNSVRTIDKLFLDAHRTKRCFGSAIKLLSPDDESNREWKDRLSFLCEELSVLEADWKLHAPALSFDSKCHTSSSTISVGSDRSMVRSDPIKYFTRESSARKKATNVDSKEVAPAESQGDRQGRPSFKRSETRIDRKALEDTLSQAMLKRFRRAWASSRV